MVGGIAKARLDGISMSIDRDRFPWANKTASVASIVSGASVMLLFAAVLRAFPIENRFEMLVTFSVVWAVAVTAGFLLLKHYFPSRR